MNSSTTLPAPVASSDELNLYTLGMEGFARVGYRFNPERWFVSDPDSEDGVTSSLYAVKPDKKHELVCVGVPLLKRRIKDPDRDDERFEIQFSDGDRSRRFTLNNSDFGSPAKLAQKAADHGLRVSDGRFLIRWLLEYERTNKVPIEIATSKCGWTRKRGAIAFALPAAAQASTGPANIVTVKPTDDDLLQFAAPFAPGEGDLREWLALTALTGAFESAYGGLILGALVASIMTARLPEGPNFLLELCGDSKRGKTAVSEAAQAFLGKPGKSGMERSWADTKFGAKASWGFMGCLPVVYEESTNAERSDKTNKITPLFLAYELPNALQRAAGKKGGGAAASDSWRLNAVITGESPILTRQQNAGALNRVVTVGYTGELGPAGVGYAFDGSVRTRADGSAQQLSFAERVSLVYKHPRMKRCYGHGLLPLIARLAAMSEEEIAGRLARNAESCRAALESHSEGAHFATLSGAILAGLELACEIVADEAPNAAFWNVETARVVLCNALIDRDEDVGGTHGYKRAWSAFREWALARRVTHFYTEGEWRGGKAQACYGIWEPVIVDAVGSAGRVDVGAADLGVQVVAQSSIGDMYVTREAIGAFIREFEIPIEQTAMIRWWAENGILTPIRDRLDKHGKPVPFSQRWTVSRARPGIALHGLYKIAATKLEQA